MTCLNKWRFAAVSVVGLGVFVASPVRAQLISTSTSVWKPVIHGSGPVTDPSVDQQTGQRESDIVGNSTNASLYTLFDPGTNGSLTDGNLYFRMRLSTDSQSAGYSGYIWIGVDADNDVNHDVDIFIGVNRQGSTTTTELHDPGAGLNTSPSTTTINSTALTSVTHTAANYNWSVVSAANHPGTLDVDGNGNDYFLSFSLPFQDLVTQLARPGVGININDRTALGFVSATSQQGNAINQDYNGGNIPHTSTSTWSQLGAISAPTAAFSSAVPEPGTLGLMATPLLCWVIRRKKRN